MSTGLSWKMKNRPGSWRKHLPAPSPSLIQAYSPGTDRPIFPFNDLPYDIQESVLRYLPVVDLIRSRAVSATFIIVYEGVVCTEFASLAGVPKPKFSSIANEFQFLYRCRHLTHPVHVTPLLLWAAARDQHVMIKRILQKALGKRISRLVTEFDEDTSFNKDDCTGSFENDMNDVMTMEMLRGANGITPLHVSCRNDHVKSTMELIKAGGDVLARDQKLQTPFYHACALGQGPAINILRTIIKHCHFLRNVVRAHKERESYDPEVEPEKKIRDIDLNMVSSEGKTCLYAAAERGHPGVVRTLLISGGHTSAKENAPTEDLELPILGVLDLEKGTKEGTPLGVACAGGKIKTVTLLLEAGANVNGCDPRGEWQTPLFLASENGKPDIIELLLDRCPPASSSAARHDGDRRTFAPPTDQIHCDLDFASKTGKTPLFIACEKGKAQCAKLLGKRRRFLFFNFILFFYFIDNYISFLTLFTCFL
jgi:ankyrin repeat protein